MAGKLTDFHAAGMLQSRVMEKEEVVSVIVPVYNVENYLVDCLESIAKQTYKNLEVVLVDDGSTDASGIICDRWVERDGRFTVIHQENRGLSAARNVGLDCSTGEYVLFVDPDDTVEPDYAEVLHRSIVEMNVSCVACGFSESNGSGSEKVTRPAYHPEIVSSKECFSSVLSPGGRISVPWAAWSKIYRSALFDGGGARFPEGRVYEDVSALFPIVHACREVGLIPDVLYRKREREGSITKTSCPVNQRDYDTAYESFAFAVKRAYPDLDSDAERFLEKRYISSWIGWRKLWEETREDDARVGMDRIRRKALDNRKALKFPADLRKYLTLLLIRFAPGLAPRAQKAWQFTVRPDRLQKNALRYGAMTAVNYLMSFLIVFYAARALAAEALGYASFASASVGYFALVAQMGIPLYGMRQCAKERGDPAKLSQTVAELFALGAMLTLAAVLLLGLATSTVPQFLEIAPLMAIYGVGLLVKCVSFEWAFKGLEEYRYLLVRSVVAKTLVLVLVILLVRGEGDLYRYAAITTLSVVVCGFADCVRLRKFVSPRLIGRLDPMRHLRPVMTFFLMSCATLIYSNLDTVMIGFMRDATEVGYYLIAAKVKVALAAVGGIVWNAALPKATQLWAEGDRAGFQLLAQRSLKFVCLVQLAATVVFMLGAEWVIVLIAGDGFLPAVPAFRILLLSLLPIGVSNVIGGQVLIPAGKERRLLAAELSGAALNLVLNFVLIPSHGIEGAAAATVAAEVVVAAIAYWYARKDLRVELFPWDRRLASAMRSARRHVKVARCRVVGLLIPDDHVKCYCPCCDMKLRAWEVASFSQRPDLYDSRRYAETPQDVVCPVCGSIPRHRIIAWHLERRPELLEGKRVLHFAPERSLTMWFKRRGVDVTTADLFAGADLRLDLMDLDLPDESYDVVVCNHVLEHVAGYRVALGELRRVLRPGGLLVISFPVDPRLETVDEDPLVTDAAGRVARFGQHDHLRVFGMDSGRILEAAGFRVEVAEGAECPERIRPVVGPADYDSRDVFFCWKE